MNKRKILVLTMALSMVAILAAGATLAYFTDTDAAVNTFTVGNVEIKIDESDITAEDPSVAPRVQANEYENVLPGVSYTKDPVVTNIGTNDAYVRVKVTVSNAMNWDYNYGHGWLSGEPAFMDMIDELGEGWTIADANYEVGTGKYGSDLVVTINYATKLAKDEETTAVFNSFALPSSLTEELVTSMVSQKGEVYIEVEAQAIQAEGFADAAAAFAALDEALADE